MSVHLLNAVCIFDKFSGNEFIVRAREFHIPKKFVIFCFPAVTQFVAIVRPRKSASFVAK